MVVEVERLREEVRRLREEVRRLREEVGWVCNVT